MPEVFTACIILGSVALIALAAEVVAAARRKWNAR